MADGLKPTVAIDFDGVLNTYTGWAGEDELFEPLDGVEGFLEYLSYAFRIVIHTTREPRRVYDWLWTHELRGYVTEVLNEKPPAVAYVDDRAVRFDGSFGKAIDAVWTAAWWE